MTSTVWNAKPGGGGRRARQALRDTASRDRRFGELIARDRTELRTVSERETPFVEEELRREGLVPPSR